MMSSAYYVPKLAAFINEKLHPNYAYMYIYYFDLELCWHNQCEMLNKIPEGRNMSTIKDEEELYQSLKNISNNS